MMRTLITLAVFGCLTLACSTVTPEEQRQKDERRERLREEHALDAYKPVLKRAAFDLNCEEESLDVVVIDKKTVGVVGCDRRARYIKVCRQYRNAAGIFANECQWVADTTGEIAAP